mmetsp:Transcript_4470/g.7645  ORF Transcript_4470/g.7645 Transcript_4470/m.7645 type:complete len:355 (+) Transcript_4470:227-1291(+)|eukprot:CAMPEP_0203766450 /NCGR_PEP_ID=MMETSP0099_2-20121227/425_1 /ASSEMBLY_ACC=CAM_ASM_000209 /TAXON_ID=96639 /ORGANISM=" , Strain NY0313808BC1" /LENGTH=354 /DNA_ID=CAMNT_0050662803 /DNA_START=81 /DNA_END=1145 /DNA_ORIENTATION=-
MGNKSSTEKMKSKRLSLKLGKAKKKEAKKLKLLLLGAGESGKSTIFKQMKHLYGCGYSEEDRKKMKPFLVGNVIEGAIDVFEASKTVEVPITDPACQKAGETLSKLEDKRTFTPEVVGHLQLMWKDKDFRQIYDKRAHYQLQDTWSEFADALVNYPAWGGPEWVPTTEEILRCRVRTTGIVDEEFNVKSVKLRMMDVGGQRNERRKWIHCFEGVTSVLFVASLSEYDQMLFEDSSKNRLSESLELFEEVSNNEWFKDSAILLFLNKTDLFEEKYCNQKVPLNKSGLFEDAPSGNDDLPGAYAWFESKFTACCKDEKRNIFIHRTCATDTKAIDVVMDACFQHILEDNLKQISEI